MAWELGAGRGHLARLVPLARELEKRGAHVLLAVRDVQGACDELQEGKRNGRNIAVIPAPLVQPKVIPPPAPAPSLAHALCRFGYSEPNILFPAVKAWHVLVRQFSPSLVVLDSAPTAGLVCRNRIPTISIGNGWTLPPTGPLPSLIEGSDPAEAEQAILATMSLMTSVNGFRQPRSVSDLMSGDENLIYTLPELDPYRTQRDLQVLRPYNVPLVRSSPATRRELFVYLPSNHPSILQVLDCLSSTPMPARVWCGKLSPLSLGNNVKILNGPTDMKTALRRSKLVIHHGGLGTATAALLAGVPQISIPIHLEHKLTANNLSKLGVGGILPSLQFDKRSLRHLILMLSSPQLTAHTLSIAKGALMCPVGGGLNGLADKCENVMAR